jgi:hypothetical protein
MSEANPNTAVERLCRDVGVRKLTPTIMALAATREGMK